MVKKAIALAVVGIMLCMALIGYFIWFQSRQGSFPISRAGEEAIENVHGSALGMNTPTKRLGRSPRADRVYWGVAKKDGRIYDCPYRIRMPRRTEITQVQSNRLALAFAHILHSYIEQDISGMMVSMREVPDIVTNIHEKVLMECCSSLNAELRSRFLLRQSVLDFADAERLDAYLRSNMELVRFLGNIALARQDFDGMVDLYDSLVLEQLLRYKHRYEETRNRNLEMCVDRFVDDWHRQIESENGFTRQSMWFQVDLQWPLYYDGTWTLAQLTSWVRRRADRLIHLGYTPKWLSEFDDLSEAVK